MHFSSVLDEKNDVGSSEPTTTSQTQPGGDPTSFKSKLWHSNNLLIFALSFLKPLPFNVVRATASPGLAVLF